MNTSVDFKKLFLENNVIDRSHWKLSSGNHAQDYVFKERLICTNPDLFDAVYMALTELVFENIDLNDFDLVSGPAVMGIPFVAPVAIGVDKPFVLSEKYTPKDGIIDGVYCPGESEMIFRPDFKKAIKGKKLILIEDVVTSGASLVKTAKAVYKAGGEVVAMFCIWDRKPERFILRPHFKSIKDTIPLYSLIKEKIQDWKLEECPLCKAGIPLIDPKTGLAIS